MDCVHMSVLLTSAPPSQFLGTILLPLRLIPNVVTLHLHTGKQTEYLFLSFCCLVLVSRTFISIHSVSNSKFSFFLWLHNTPSLLFCLSIDRRLWVMSSSVVFCLHLLRIDRSLTTWSHAKSTSSSGGFYLLLSKINLLTALLTHKNLRILFFHIFISIYVMGFLW